MVKTDELRIEANSSERDSESKFFDRNSAQAKRILLAFNYFDRYLSRKTSSKQELAILSAACLCVASKVCSSEASAAAKPEQLDWLFGRTTLGQTKTMESLLVRLSLCISVSCILGAIMYLTPSDWTPIENVKIQLKQSG